MERLPDIWGWVDAHWKSWGIYAVILGVSNFVTWILARRKDWNEWRASRQAKADRKIDAQVLQAIGNPTLWGNQRPMTGSGIPYVRAAEIAEHLSLDSDTVSDSLERLEQRGRVERSGGNYSDPSPTWRIVPR
jgi:hypothetical protein